MSMPGAAAQGDAAIAPLPPHSSSVEEEMQRVRMALHAVFAPTGAATGPTAQASHDPIHNERSRGSNGGSASTSDAYSPGDPMLAERHLADRYLTSFQTQPIAWMVCDRLLQDGNEHECFFAAQTLHTKCRLDVHQLPAESLPSLRDSLLAQLNRYAGAPAPSQALLTRLAMAASALAVQMGWTTVVSDLLHSNQHSHPVLLLLVLTVLPEECASDRLVPQDEAVRFQVRDHLVATAPLVFQFFQAQFQAHTPRVLQAFWTWIRWVPIHPSSLLESSLLRVSIQTLHQTQFLEQAADIVVEILRMYPSHVPGNEQIVQWLMPLLSQLPIQDALRSNDEDVLRNYCRVVTEMGESYMSRILSPLAADQHSQERQLSHERALVESVLQCSAIQNSEVASITLHFWYRLIMDLECVDPYEWRQELVNIYEPQILRLIDICATSLIKYPADIDDLPEDIVEDLHRHRYYVTETVEDCCRLLGGQMILQRVGDIFGKEIQMVTRGQQQNQAEWRGIEACLACIGAIARFVPSDESVLLPQCFRLIPQLRQDIKPLRFTASKMIGKYASWLALHPELSQPLLPFLAAGLDIPECAPASAIAIKELCECANANFVIAEPVMQLYGRISDAEIKHLALQDELHILEGLCRALSRQVLDHRLNGSEVLISLANPVGHRLAAAVQSLHASARRIIPEVDRLTIIIQYLTIIPDPSSNHHPVVDLMATVWSLLEQAISRFPSDNMLAEKICRLHKHALRTVGPNWYLPVLDPLISQLVSSFEMTKQSPYLYAASIVVSEYGQTATYSEKLFDMVVSMSTSAFSCVKDFQDMTNQPDIVEELFYLMGRVMNSFPERIMASSLLNSLLQGATVAMQLDHHHANKGTLDFLDRTFSYGLSLRRGTNQNGMTALESALVQHGPAIVSNLARALMGDLPCYSNQIPDLLWKLNQLCPSLLARWLMPAFDSAPLPERAKKDFMGALETGLAHDEFNLAASAFQTACARTHRFRKNRRSR